MVLAHARYFSTGSLALALIAIITSLPAQGQDQNETTGSQEAVIALAQIEREGGTIDIERADGETIPSIEAVSKNIKDNEITALNFLDLKKLQKALAQTSKLKGLKRLSINFCWTGPTALSAKEIEKIVAIPTLEELSLADTQVAPKLLKQLAKIPNLKIISLGELNTKGTFTDAHIDALANIKSAKTLAIPGLRKITDAAITRFKAARPDCKVVGPKRPKPKKAA